ncbi:disease resistance-like protein DSC1 [Argentina anserina]|uniref:disease resistance-like protein DSC1 n=1 Tax=Argentina anserina TaxID=57926 RepID=UPI00217686C5|nr:disease resistance-like protein DSC1 [Potentilla anserina]
MASSSAPASASTDIPSKEKYDVFLSFRGPDTRETFISHLKKALDDKKIETFIDDNLERGEEIAPALLKAIERSMISVIIFSKNYASSRWCLDELVHILECREKCGKHVLPIFYKTVVSDIRHQRRSYRLEKRFKDRTESELLKWKVALTNAANLSGFESNKTRNDSDLIQEVVHLIVKKLGYESSRSELSGFVGVKSRVLEIESLLSIIPGDDRVRFVVIWGMGGIGKTTLADAAFHRLSGQFDACCFLGDVREGSGTRKELKDLRNKLLGTLLGDKSLDIQGESIDHVTRVKLGRKKVLVVLDDVNDSRQLELLVGHHHVPFGSGSRIIITTRDKKQLDEVILGGNHDTVIYKVKELDDVEAHQLLRLKAPKDIAFTTSSTEVLIKVVMYAAGVPLALRTLRPLFYKGALNEMEKISSEKLRSVYQVSYDLLTDDEKNIFLDVACFHKGTQIEDAKGHMNGCCLNVSSGISALVEMSLIELRNGKLWMHDVIQEMGRDIVQKQCLEEAGKRSRLYTVEDVYHVLQNITGTAKVQAMCTWESNFNFRSAEGELNLNPQVFKEMYNLRYLDLFGLQYTLGSDCKLPKGLEFLPKKLRYLSWPGFPLTSLPPSKFSACFLVELYLPRSHLQTLGDKDQNLEHLKKIDLSNSRDLVEVRCLTKSKCLECLTLAGCVSLVQVPNISESLNIVSINLQGCKKLVEVPSYFEKLHKLTVLNLRKCLLLESIPEMPSNIEFLLLGSFCYSDRGKMKFSGLPSSIWSLKKLVELDLDSCNHIQNLPDRIRMMKSLTSIDLSRTSIKCLPSSIECLSRIASINLVGCSDLVSLSTSIWKLEFLEALNLSGCTSFEFFPEILEPMECLKTLRLSETKIEEIHDSIENLVGLEELDLSSCKRLKSVSNNICKLIFLQDFRIACCPELKKLPILSTETSSWLSRLDLSWCTSLEEIPDAFLICLTSLKELDLSGTRIKSIPTSIKELTRLTDLYVWNCKYLESLPELPYFLKYLNANGCTNLEMVSFSMTAAAQGLDQICVDEYYFVREEKYSFRSCPKLSETAKGKMLDNAQLRIMRMANLLPRREQIYPGFIYLGTRDHSIAIVYPGNEIPEWFMYQAEGSSINIKLPEHPSYTNTNFWQLILCAVLTIDKDEHEDEDELEDDSSGLYLESGDSNFCCNSNFTTDNGDCSELNFLLPSSSADEDIRLDLGQRDKSLVFVWYSPHWSTHICNASDAWFEFYIKQNPYLKQLCFFPHNHDLIKVKRCGVRLLSSQGQDVILGGVDQDVGEPKPEQVTLSKRSCDQYEASGSATVTLLDLENRN